MLLSNRLKLGAFTVIMCPRKPGASCCRSRPTCHPHYPTCILSRGWNTLGYTQNTLRYTYPHPHTWPDPCASGIHQDTTGYNRIHPLVRIPTGCTQYLQIRPEYEEDLVSASYSPHCSCSTGPAAQGPASAAPGAHLVCLAKTQVRFRTCTLSVCVWHGRGSS